MMTDKEIRLQIALGTFDIRNTQSVAIRTRSPEVMKALTLYSLRHYRKVPLTEYTLTHSGLFQTLLHNECTPKDVQGFLVMLFQALQMKNQLKDFPMRHRTPHKSKQYRKHEKQWIMFKRDFQNKYRGVFK